jgi:hypothetical protein
MSEPPSAIDQLLALPPGEFIAARNRLAADLKKRDPEQAAAIKALPKPSASTWALNHVARRAPEKIATFLAACDALERAQSGRGGSDETRRSYQAALAAQREALDGAVGAAQEALVEAGLPTNRTVLDRITNDLRWAVMGAETRRALEEGRLTRDLEPPDFSALVERIPLVPAREHPHKGPQKAPAGHAPAPPAREDHRRRLHAVRTRHATAEQEVAGAQEDLREAETAAAEAARALAAVRRELATAERRAAETTRAETVARETLARRTAERDRLAAELAEVTGEK